MWQSFRKSLETEERPLIGPDIWMLEILGLLLPKNKLHKFMYMVLHHSVTFFVFTQLVELYVVRNDLDAVLTNLKISMLSFICILKTNTYLIWQKKWLQVLDYVNTADKYERANRNEAKGKILDSYTKYCHTLTYSYWVLISFTIISTTAPPFIFMSSSKFREELNNGTVTFPHIFSSWMPFDKYSSTGSWVTVFWHSCMSLYGGTSMAAYDSTVIVIMVFFGGKLDLLRERCKQMLGSNGESVSDETAMNTIKELHSTHILLTEYSRLFNSLLSPVMFFYVVMASVMLCASAFQFTSSTDVTQKILVAEYLVFGVAQLFLFCWHSNDVLQKSNQVSYGPFENQWWMASLRQKKVSLILTGQLHVKHVFTAGPFTNLTLSTFITILKGAYSYYTLLRK